MFIAGVFVLPLPSLFVLIVGSLLVAISGLYATNKIYQHTQGFFKSKTDKLSAEFDDKILDIFLQRVAFGMQDNAEHLFTNFYSGNTTKIQKALQYQGAFTDYSGRKFKCSAYEYAYWAKDTHMCRMLEHYMDEKTKVMIAARIDEMELIGLPYSQAGQEYRTTHFDFTPLKQAYQCYLDVYAAPDVRQNWVALKATWLNVGKAQRNVPAHVAQEYCRSDRTFYPVPKFNEATLPRELTFNNNTAASSWFPLASTTEYGLGFSLTLVRNFHAVAASVEDPWSSSDMAMCRFKKETQYARDDYDAITCLDEVRTADLTQSRQHLNNPALPQFMSV